MAVKCLQTLKGENKMSFCQKCGAETNSQFCAKCGSPVSGAPGQSSQQQSGLVCPNCGGHNVMIQAVGITKNKHHGLAWWLFVSWWIWIFWLCFFLFMLILRLLRGNRVKTKVVNYAVCQSCGNRWKV